MTAPKVSLAQQIEAVRFAETRQRVLADGGKVQGMRGRAVEQYDLVCLNAAATTLEWMKKNEAEIREAVAAIKARKDAAKDIGE